MRISDWSSDVCSSDLRLPGLWHRLGEAALEAHKRRPIDIEAPMADALAVQPPRPISGLRGTDQDLLGVAAAQGAGAAERPLVDHRDRPAGLAAALGRHRRRGSRAEAAQVTTLNQTGQA